MLSAHLLLTLCCTPAKQMPPPVPSNSTQTSEAEGAAQQLQLPLEPVTTAFLKGSAAVPRSTLQQMQPQLLVGLFQELSSREPHAQVCS